MFLVDARNDVLRRADWAPTQSDDMKTVMNGFFDEVLREVAGIAPFGLLETEITINTQAPIEPDDDTDTLSVALLGVGTEDPWTVQRPGHIVATPNVSWPVDRTYDGRELLVKVDDTRWVRHRIRQMFVPDGNGNPHMTLYEPQDPGNFGDGLYDECDWYVHEPILWLPGDCIEVKSVRIENTNTGPLLAAMPEQDAERLMLKVAPEDGAVGEPRWWFLWGTHHMPAPRVAPVVALDAGAGTWNANENDPPGEFQYAYTWAWGRRSSPRAHPGPGGQLTPRKEPLWESALSPASSAITVTAAGNGVKITVPDIERLQGFNDNTTIRYQHSGWFVRVYRRRLDTASAGALVEEPAGYHLIAETADVIYQVNDEDVFYDGGGNLPDYFTRPPDTGGYFGLGLYPRPNGTYPVTIRYIRMPRRMVDDYDELPVHAAFEPIIKEMVLARVHEMRGNAGEGAICRHRAAQALAEARNTMPAFDTPGSTVRYRRHARGRRVPPGYPIY